jgi:hypothetical protein
MMMSALVAAPAVAAFPDDWSFKLRFEVDHTKIDETITDFPVAVVLNKSNFGFSQASPDGFDVRFAAEDGVTLLDFERELHDPDALHAVYWVRLPSVSHTQNTLFFIYYGNPLATDAADTTGAVWDNNHVAVWHLNEESSGTADEFKDASGNARHGTGFGVGGNPYPTRVQGSLGYGQRFSGGNAEGIRALIPSPGATFTLTTWVNLNAGALPTANPGIAQAQNGGLTPSGTVNAKIISAWARQADGDAWGRLVQSNGISINLPQNGTAVLSRETWHYLAYVADGALYRLFMDGVEVKSVTYNNTLQVLDRIFLGKQHGTESWFGMLDEARLSDNVRSNAWIRASYHSGNNTLLLYSDFDERRRAVRFFDSPSFVGVYHDASISMSTAGTVEAWIRPDALHADAGIVMKGSNSSNLSYGFGLGGGSLFDEGTSRNIGFLLYNQNNAGYLLTADGRNLSENKWHHIACVWDTSVGNQYMRIYINGILENQRIDLDAVPIRTNTADMVIGLRDVGSSEGQFFGAVDELRVWNEARDADDIRRDMCRTINPVAPEPEPSCYLRFDEAIDPLCIDISGNENIGVMNNAVRVCSTAPIGDESEFDYGNDGYEVEFEHLQSSWTESLTAVIDSGSRIPGSSGIHVYRVNEAPDYRSGPLGMRLFPDRGYWGVFVTGGSAPRYDVVYNYDEGDDGIPGVGREENLRLAFRHGNCEIWKDLSAELDTGAKTLTKEGQVGTEYILGIEMDPRNAILYDGTDDYVDCGNDASLRITGTNITVEAWIYPTDFKTNHWDNTIVGMLYWGLDVGNLPTGYALRYGSANRTLSFAFGNGAAWPELWVDNVLTLDAWQHVSATYDGANIVLYVNGVSVGNQAETSDIADTGNFVNLNIGAEPYDPGNRNMAGRIDEVRVWSVARSQTDIRDTMCRKLDSAVDVFTNLAGYWRFDEETDSDQCPDYSINNNVGTMNGWADAAAIRNARVCSSAPIGDDSAHHYNAGASNASLLHPQGDSLQAAASGGTWAAGSGIHVYRLDEPPVYPPHLWVVPGVNPGDPPIYSYESPNGLTPPTGWSSVDYYRYWGVFVTDPATADQPRYDVVYNYDGNPMAPQDETELRLARRDEYCGEWVDPALSLTVTLDTSANTITIDDDTQNGPPKQNPEYILAGEDEPLAIILAAFTAAVTDNGCIEIQWETATDIDTTGFYLWRSTQRDGEYEMISNSYTRSKSLMETMGARYAFTDCGVDFASGDRYYYKLEEIEVGPREARHFYGPIGPVSETVGASQQTRDFSPARSSGSSGNISCFIGVLTE